MDSNELIENEKEHFLDLLAKFVSYADFSETGEHIQETANFLVDLLKQMLHADVKTYETPGSPVIVATICPGKRDAYLFYGHYDVQTTGDQKLWNSDPFKLTKKGGRLFGRGAGDNKGQLMAQICGFYVYQQLYGDLPFTAKLFIEGEEESGSPDLNTTVNKLKFAELKDVTNAFVIDGSFNQSGDHVLRLGNRGDLAFRIKVHTSDTDLHSGNFGNVSRDAAQQLAIILNRLVDPLTLRPRVPALQQNIVPPTSQEIEWMRSLPEPTNVPSPLYQSKLDYYERLMFEPTLTVNGLTSGYEGPKAKTIIPGEATAILDSRLVANQKCADVQKGIERMLQPELDSGLATIEWLVSLEPTKVASSNPLISTVSAAIKEATGNCLIEPTMPGSVPNYVWTQTLGVPTFTIPYANYDQHNHAPNENITEQAYLDGIRISVALCKNLK